MNSNKENSMRKENKKELFKNLDKLKIDVVSLRNELNKINNEKESWFKKKKELSKNIRERIEIIKENKAKRDSLTRKVKELKEKRDILNQQTRKKISEFKKLNNEKNVLVSKSKIKDPLEVKGEIDKIETKLETEAMSFEAEKKLSKKLKELKKSLEEASALLSTIDEVKKLNNEINDIKQNTNKVHDEIQKTAKESQELHELVLADSKGVDGLRIKEGETFKNFMNLKENFNDANNKLKEKLIEMGNIGEKINKYKLEEEEKRKLKEGMLVKAKELEIEEKIRKGKKLTTDDLLVFQNIIKDKNL